VTGYTMRPPTSADHDRWRYLYAGYAAFCRGEQGDQAAETVWR